MLQIPSAPLPPSYLFVIHFRTFLLNCSQRNFERPNGLFAFQFKKIGTYRALRGSLDVFMGLKPVSYKAHAWISKFKMHGDFGVQASAGQPLDPLASLCRVECLLAIWMIHLVRSRQPAFDTCSIRQLKDSQRETFVVPGSSDRSEITCESRRFLARDLTMVHSNRQT